MMKPFSINFDEKEIENLKQRIRNTKFSGQLNNEDWEL